MVELIAVLCLVALAALLVGLNLRSLPKSPVQLICFLIKPPAFSKADQASSIDHFNQLYAVISELLDNKPLKPSMAVILEAVFSAQYGTSLLVRMPEAIAEVIKNQLLALSPRLAVNEVSTAIELSLEPGLITRVDSWRRDPKSLSSHDVDSVVGMLAANLRGLKGSEYASWQVMLSSAKPTWYLKLLRSVMQLSLNLIRASINFGLELSDNDPRRARQRADNRRVKQAAHLPAAHSQPVLRVGLRSMIAASSNTRIERLSLAVNTAAKINGLSKIRITDQTAALKAFNDRSCQGRTYLMERSRLIQLFNVPEPGGRWEEDAKLSFSTELAAGANNQQSKIDIVLGVSGERVVGLTKTERQMHTLIVGGTGMGKSTLLGYSFVQDMVNGKGVALIDPHGDLASSMLKYVPKERVADVIYIDPAQVHYPVAINLMELPRGLSGDELATAKDFIAEAIVSIFRKVFSDDDSGGHRIEYVLRNAIYTAFTIPGATLLTLHKLLTNDVYRAGVVSQINDDTLKDFWYGEYAKAGNYQRVKMISGVTAKLGRFERSIAVSRMINKALSTLNFEQLINQHKILICNFAKGAIGEDSSALLGMVVLAKLQLAALRRALQPSSKRTPYYLYIDEFELFNAPIFSQLISESRKFGMHLTLAEQTTAYQNDRDSNILLANVGNVISFRTAAAVDNHRLLPLYSPYLVSSDLANLEPFSYYLKSTGEQAKRPVSAQTIQLLGKGSDAVASRVIRSSRQHYSYPYIEQKEKLAQLNRVPMVRG